MDIATNPVDGRDSPPIEDILNEILENDSYDPNLIEKEFNDDDDFLNVDFKEDNLSTKSDVLSSQTSITSLTSTPSVVKPTTISINLIQKVNDSDKCRAPSKEDPKDAPNVIGNKMDTKIDTTIKKVISLKPILTSLSAPSTNKPKDVPKTIPMMKAAKPAPTLNSNLITLTNADRTSDETCGQKRRIKRDAIPNPVLKYPIYRGNIPASLDEVVLDEDAKERIDKFILKKKAPIKERLGRHDKNVPSSADGDDGHKMRRMDTRREDGGHEKSDNFKRRRRKSSSAEAEDEESSKDGSRDKRDGYRDKKRSDSDIRRIEVISSRGPNDGSKPGLLPNPVFDGSSPVKIHVNPKFAEKLQQQQQLAAQLQQQQQQKMILQQSISQCINPINALLSTSLIMSQPQFQVQSLFQQQINNNNISSQFNNQTQFNNQSSGGHGHGSFGPGQGGGPSMSINNNNFQNINSQSAFNMNNSNNNNFGADGHNFGVQRDDYNRDHGHGHREHPQQFRHHEQHFKPNQRPPINGANNRRHFEEFGDNFGHQQPPQRPPTSSHHRQEPPPNVQFHGQSHHQQQASSERHMNHLQPAFPDQFAAPRQPFDADHQPFAGHQPFYPRPPAFGRRPPLPQPEHGHDRLPPHNQHPGHDRPHPVHEPQQFGSQGHPHQRQPIHPLLPTPRHPHPQPHNLDMIQPPHHVQQHRGPQMMDNVRPQMNQRPPAPMYQDRGPVIIQGRHQPPQRPLLPHLGGPRMRPGMMAPMQMNHGHHFGHGHHRMM